MLRLIDPKLKGNELPMNPTTYIKQRQIQWALRNDKRLGGQYRNNPDPVQQARGEKSFVYKLDDNLFETLSEEAHAEFKGGDGNETENKMFAVNSSSAIAVNVFHYWKNRGHISEIARACEVPSTRINCLRFEAQFPIHQDFRRPPNIDVVIEYANRTGLLATAIECKFDEPFGGWAKHGLKPLYLEHAEFWTDLPNLREIAGQVSPDNDRFVHLDVPQLLKHILGLKAKYGRNGFRLLYLWYDVAGPEAIKHRLEIAEFAAVACMDAIAFQSLTYQDIILSVARSQRKEHRKYVDYLVERYL
jgi:hypothetical protein